jgi:hypothetical protein
MAPASLAGEAPLRGRREIDRGTAGPVILDPSVPPNIPCPVQTLAITRIRVPRSPNFLAKRELTDF